MENIGFLLRKPTIFFLYFRNYNLICRAFPSPKRRSPSRNSQWPRGPKRGFGNSFQPAIDAPRYYLTSCVIAPSAKMVSEGRPPPALIPTSPAHASLR